MLLDLDDTVIVEESHARAQLRATAALVDGVDPASWDEVVIAAARSHWYSSEYYPVFRKLGIASWEGLWATFEGSHPVLGGVAVWSCAYRDATWAAALGEVSADVGRARVLSGDYVARQRAGHPLVPGAMATIERLAAHAAVVMVTNGPPDIQRHKIEQAKIGPYLSAVVVSGELGIGKPDPAGFLHALDLVGTAPENALMIGDSWERDVEGALACGMRAVWISHDRRAPRHDTRVRVASGLADVPEP